jgi:dihydroorotate dehydrogenase
VSIFYRNIVRPLLFRQNPEVIHNRTLGALRIASRNPVLSGALSACYGAPALPVECLGLRFPNPIGLAAGMDKHAEALPAWAAMGFGFTELGAVTWHPQPGNPSPRVFRIIPEEAIINRMGFNNPGAEAVAKALEKWREEKRWPKHPVGMNLGKSKITPLDKAAEDYASSFRVLRPLLDFFVVNVSSPNTPNLRQLQDKSALQEIFAALNQVQSSLPASEQRPILVKVAPDLTFDALDDIVGLLGPCRIAGIVATNTTITRPTSTNPEVQAKYAETGGLSGKPLRARSTEIIAHLYRQTQGHIPIIGVGGIFTAADAWEKIVAGASLLQVYTSLVYEGPGLCRTLVQGLQSQLKVHSISSLQNAIGSNHAFQSKVTPGANTASQRR